MKPLVMKQLEVKIKYLFTDEVMVDVDYLLLQRSTFSVIEPFMGAYCTATHVSELINIRVRRSGHSEWSTFYSHLSL